MLCSLLILCSYQEEKQHQQENSNINEYNKNKDTTHRTNKEYTITLREQRTKSSYEYQNMQMSLIGSLCDIGCLGSFCCVAGYFAYRLWKILRGSRTQLLIVSNISQTRSSIGAKYHLYDVRCLWLQSSQCCESVELYGKRNKKETAMLQIIAESRRVLKKLLHYFIDNRNGMEKVCKKIQTFSKLGIFQLWQGRHGGATDDNLKKKNPLDWSITNITSKVDWNYKQMTPSKTMVTFTRLRLDTTTVSEQLRNRFFQTLTRHGRNTATATRQITKSSRQILQSVLLYAVCL